MESLPVHYASLIPLRGSVVNKELSWHCGVSTYLLLPPRGKQYLDNESLAYRMLNVLGSDLSFSKQAHWGQAIGGVLTLPLFLLKELKGRKHVCSINDYDP